MPTYNKNETLFVNPKSSLLDQDGAALSTTLSPRQNLGVAGGSSSHSVTTELMNYLFHGLVFNIIYTQYTVLVRMISAPSAWATNRHRGDNLLIKISFLLSRE